MKFNRRSLAAFAVMSLLTLFIGCSGSGGGGTVGSGGTGTLSLSLTDAPNVEYEAVYVTIDRVDVHLGGNEASPNNWQTITPPESGETDFVKKTYNLLELTNGVLEELGMTELPPGLYTQIRLIIGTVQDEGSNIFGDAHQYANYIILKNTENQIPLTVPGGTQTGIKLVKSFTVAENQLTGLILDFDAARSVIKAGNSGKYLLKPTIKVLGTEVLSNFIEGTVRDGEGMPLQDVLVSAQVSDPSAGDPRDEVVVAASSPTDVNGRFRILVQPGTYNIVAYKDKYSFAFECDVVAAAGETIELVLPNLETEELGYGYVSGDVTGAGDVTISFRASGCGEGNIEVKSIIMEVGVEGASYAETLPVLPVDTFYEVAASSDGKTTVVEPNIEVESGVATDLDLVIE